MESLSEDEAVRLLRGRWENRRLVHNPTLTEEEMHRLRRYAVDAYKEQKARLGLRAEESCAHWL